MKTINFRNFLAVILCCFTVTVYAQNASSAQANEPEEEVPNTLTEQFVYLKKKSNSWQEYKVIKKVMLDNFWTNIQDSLAMFHQQLDQTQAKIDAQQKEIRQKDETITAKDKAVQASEHASTHISVLGMDILKGGFLSFFWISVSVLGLLLAMAVYQYKRSHRQTAKTRRDYSSLQHELEEVRKTSLERERKLRRELQTERNAVEELKTMVGQKDKSRFY